MLTMKKARKCFWALLAVAALVLPAASCSPAAQPSGQDGRELLHLGFALPGEPRPKSSGTAESESRISRMDLFVFDSRGLLDLYHPFSPTEISARSATVSVRTGMNTVWLVANVPFREEFLGGLESEDQLKAYVLEGFAGDIPMSTCVQLEIPEGGLDTPPEFVLSRLVSRIVLGRITNALQWPNADRTFHLYGAVLCNVVATCSLSGPVPSPSWFNREGTRDHRAGQVIGRSYPWYYTETEPQYLERMHLTDGSGRNLYELRPQDPALAVPDREDPGLSACFNLPVLHGESLTLTAGNVFYAFPNACAEPNSGWHDEFVETATVLLVMADVGGIRYWYPVPLTAGLDKNCEYVVNLTVTGPGNDDTHWFDRLDKVSMVCSVDVAEWDQSLPVDETI